MGNFFRDIQNSIDRAQSDGFQWLGFREDLANTLATSDQAIDDNPWENNILPGIYRAKLLLDGDVRGALTDQQVQAYQFEREQFLDKLKNEDDSFKSYGPSSDDYSYDISDFNAELSVAGGFKDPNDKDPEKQNIFRSISPDLDRYSQNFDDFGKEMTEMRTGLSSLDEEKKKQRKLTEFDSFIQQMIGNSLSFHLAEQATQDSAEGENYYG